MMALRLPKELDEKLEQLAKETERSKSYLVRKAIAQYLEDREDYQAAVKALEESEGFLPYDEVRKELRLENTHRQKSKKRIIET